MFRCLWTVCPCCFIYIRHITIPKTKKYHSRKRPQQKFAQDFLSLPPPSYFFHPPDFFKYTLTAPPLIRTNLKFVKNAHIFKTIILKKIITEHILYTFSVVFTHKNRVDTFNPPHPPPPPPNGQEKENKT